MDDTDMDVDVDSAQAPNGPCALSIVPPAPSGARAASISHAAEPLVSPSTPPRSPARKRRAPHELSLRTGRAQGSPKKATFPRPESPTKPRTAGRPASPTGCFWSTSRPSSPTKSPSWFGRSGSPTKPSSEPWCFNTPDSPISSQPSSPTKFNSPNKPRPRPPSLRLQENPNGIDPSSLVGKTLRKVQRSAKHPSLTLLFTDKSAVQVHVDGYNPHSQGVPKVLEMDQLLEDALAHENVDLLIADCTMVQLTDKAFDKTADRDLSSSSLQWDQRHLGVAFKFDGLSAWHCISAAMNDFDEDLGMCRFRSYEDVYLSPLSPTSHRRRQSYHNIFPKEPA